MELSTILTIIFGILAAFFGVYWNKAKTVIAEVKILFGVISDALADDTLTKEELTAITDQIKKILASFKASSVKEAVANLKSTLKRK